jgi:hypothetical protein
MEPMDPRVRIMHHSNQRQKEDLVIVQEKDCANGKDPHYWSQTVS